MCAVPTRSPRIKTKKRDTTVFLQVKVSRRAADLLRKRAKRALRSQASYLRAVIYRDLGIFSEIDSR
jgi:hypothetical protein